MTPVKQEGSNGRRKLVAVVPSSYSTQMQNEAANGNKSSGILCVCRL